MKIILCIYFALFLFGCNIEGPTNIPVLSGKNYYGSFKISSTIDSSKTYYEMGTIEMVFTDSTYSYKANYNDTTSGRGKIFKNGLHDGGNYTRYVNILSMKDSAVKYGLGTITGSPSLYLNGDYHITETNNQIVFTNKQSTRNCVIELSK